ncbi:hypothetical protein FRC07_002220 [Ceratobasidium sp. 392]|nr:hypothetical protein FRC07_002220 [Ceratobasidium sp. 392]
MEVSIWAPPKNAFIGAWVKIQNVTEEQIAPLEEEDSISVEDVLRCQTCAIAWSSSWSGTVWDLPTATSSSLLALGNRYGDVNFFCWDSASSKARHCLTYHVGDAWIANLAWSQWKPAATANSSQNTHAYLACGLSDGSVWILLIEHDPNLEEPYLVSKLPIAIEADSRSIAAMAFAGIGTNRQLLLAVAKPGFVYLYRQSESSDNRMSEDVSRQTVLLSATRTSMASTHIASCAGKYSVYIYYAPLFSGLYIGLYYIPSDDCLVVVLAEGSLNVIACASGTAYLKEGNGGPGQSTTTRTSKAMRGLTEAAEECSLSQAEYAKIHGLQPIGTGEYVVWTQVVFQAYDLSYRLQANFKTRVCVAKLWDRQTDNNDRIIASVKTALNETKSIACFSPIALLQEVMLEMLNPDAIALVAPRLLPMLSPDWEPNHSDEARDANSGAIAPSFVRRTRLKFSLALFILVSNENISTSIMLADVLQNRSILPNELVPRIRVAHDKLLELSMALHIHETVGKVLGGGIDGELGAHAWLVFWSS